MRIKYNDWNPSLTSMRLVEIANEIIEEYEADGDILTLRQLYYQFVARGIIENTERSYKNLGTVITKGRMAGMISWEAIEDRNREHHDFWSVVARACDPLLVPHMACKGYLSASEAWRAGQRFQEAQDAGKECRVIHLGDHDPSGMDMTRDNQSRLNIFADYGVQVDRIALNMDQVDEYSPPPNPAKITDSRAKEYIKQYGRSSWELDALEPKMLRQLITDEIEQYIDREVWEDTLNEERSKQRVLRELYHRWDEIEELLT